uniref:diguanylate cyclase domain-containing protein n=1 Tax=Geobacillus sp. (strain Y412MC10) TaxID=481743 RepID=UPI001C92BFEC
VLIFWGGMFFERDVVEKVGYEDRMRGLGKGNEMKGLLRRNAERDKIRMVFVDVEQFKAIKDTVGDNVGDLVVEEVGKGVGELIGRGEEVLGMEGRWGLRVDGGEVCGCKGKEWVVRKL